MTIAAPHTRAFASGLALLHLLAGPWVAAAQDRASAFATGVGAHDASSSRPAVVTLYVVPEGRRFLLSDVVVANVGQEHGPLLLADSTGTRLAIGLTEPTTVNQGPGVLQAFKNPHVTLSTPLVFEAGEPLTATLDGGGGRGVDVTLSGRLVFGPRRVRAVQLPGGARPDPAEEPSAAAGER